MSKYLKLSIALILFFGVIAWVEYELTWSSVWSSWQAISIQSLASVLMLTFASYLLRAQRIYSLFAQPDHRFCDYLNIHLLHNALNNFLPMRLGEASFPLLMKRRFNTALLTSSGSLIWIRVIDLHWLISCMLLILCIEFSWLFLIGLLLWLALPFWLYITSFKAIDLCPKLIKKHWHALATNIPQNTAQLGIVYLQTILLWSCKLIALSIVLISFINVGFWQALFGVISADLSSVLPIHGVAGTGTYEAAMIAGMAPFISYSEDLLLATINVHIYLLISTLLSVPIAFLLPSASSNK